MISLYTNLDYCVPPEACAPNDMPSLADVLVPLMEALPSEHRLHRYSLRAGELFRLEQDFRRADFAVLPMNYERYWYTKLEERVVAFSRLAEQQGVPLLVFHLGDSTFRLPVRGHVFRASMYASKRAPDEHAMPANYSTVAGRLEQALPPRPYSTLPTVGFCGQIGPKITLKKAIKYELIRWAMAFHVHPRPPPPSGLLFRRQLLERLERNPGVATTFIRHDRFRAGASRRQGDPERTRQAENEFIQNLAGSDYVLCVRGGGNFSMRLYETLAAGRIPVFVNTDCCLPFEDRIDWKQHVVWVKYEEAREVGAMVARFHAGLGPERFRAMQEQNRRLWEDWLSPEAFFAHLHEWCVQQKPRATALRSA